MAKRTEKEPLYSTRGQKTIQGDTNRMMMDDGRKKFENLSREERFICTLNYGSIVKKNKK